MKNYELLENITLLRIPPYTPELNPSEKIWAYIKQFYKNKVFENLETLKIWLNTFIKENLNKEIVKSITHYQFYNNNFTDHFEI